MHLQAEAVRGGRLAPDLGHARLIAGEAQAAIHLPAGRLAGLGLEAAVELDRVFEELGHVGRAAQLAHEARGMEARAAREPVPLEEHDLAPAEPCQMIGRRAADDAAADDDRPRRRGEIAHGRGPARSKAA